MGQSNQKAMKSLLLIILFAFVIAIFFYLFNMQKDGDDVPEVHLEKATYNKAMNKVREEKDVEFADSTTSRFNAEERAEFHGLNYFEPDSYYRIKVVFSVDTSTPVFKMPTNTERTPNYRIYGFFDFKIHDTICRLTAFQNMDFKDDPEWGGYLFVPFSDKTSGNESYGAGRYIDIKIPAEENVFLDFNEAYNPYCAYSDRWSCPLVPFENYLEVRIPAGEKKYNH